MFNVLGDIHNFKNVANNNYFFQNHIKTHKEHYDAVVASEVIEHITDKQLFVNSCVAATKPGGRLFFTTPNKTRISQFLTIFVVENIIKIVKKGTHQYDKFITPNELTFLLERSKYSYGND